MMNAELVRLGWGVLVHGGAGRVEPERHSEHVAGCEQAAQVGAAIVEAGGSALEAVVAAARVLEDLPQFNAGTGGALNERGAVEHDAALMCGRTLAAGAVAALASFKNPIEIAHEVMRDGRHVLLVAEGAAAFARSRGHAACDPASLITERAKLALEKTRAGQAPRGWAGGTIGAVARDRAGHLAAATSTGGIVNKLLGRVGDSPIVGAGTLADDEVLAVSATGDGEGILRVCLASDLAARLRAGGEPVATAREVLSRLQTRTGATGGVIFITPGGAAVFARSTETMSFACAGELATRSGI